MTKQLFFDSVRRNEFQFDFICFDWNGTIEPTYDEEKKQALKGLESSKMIDRFHFDYKKEKKRVRNLLKKEKDCDLEFSKKLVAKNVIDNLEEDIVDIIGEEKYDTVRKDILNAFSCKYLLPGAIETLSTIVHDFGIPIGLVRNSSTTSSIFNSISLEPTGASRFFNIERNVVLAGEFGVEKPDPRIFHGLLDKCRAKKFMKRPERILMVGNCTKEDIIGGRSVGFKTALIKTTEKTSGGIADFEINELPQLIKIIRGL